jgi:phytoene dehydrogenase-like protein
VGLAGGEDPPAPIVVTACHPQITFLRQIERSELPPEFVNDVEHWSSRSGVVKINLAVSELPTLAARPEWKDFSGGFEIAPSLAQLELAFEEARRGEPATFPFSDGVVPTTLDPSLAPEGVHIVSLFTQWVPHTWSQAPHREELEAYADRVVRAYDDVATGFAASVIERQVLGAHDMETEWGLIGGNIFHGELSADQLFHMRPVPGYADYRTPIRGLYQCSSATHAGGGVCGIPAYNCVREIRRDRRRRRNRR